MRTDLPGPGYESTENVFWFVVTGTRLSPLTNRSVEKATVATFLRVSAIGCSTFGGLGSD